MRDPSAPLFSVLLLVSDKDKRLDGAARSLFAQRMHDFEIIAIDIAASDWASDRVGQFAGQSTVPMRVVRATGIGRPGAWNSAASAARGRYLAFLDADDEYPPDRLDAFRRAHSICGGFEWGFSGVEAIDEEGRPIAVETIRGGMLRSQIYASGRPVDAIRNLPHMFTPVSCGNLVVDADVFRRLGGFRDLRYLFDWDLALRLFRTSDPVTIERPLYRHQIRPGGSPAGGDPTSRAPLVDQEQSTIVEEYRRGLVQDGLADSPLAPSGSVGRTPPLEPDARVAIAAALWGLDRLRRVPLLYKTARRTARAMRRRQGRIR